AFSNHDYRVTFAIQYTLQVAIDPALSIEHRRHFRDQHQVYIGRGHRRLTRHETGVTAHQFDQADTIARSGGLHVCAANDFHRRRISALEAEAAIDEVDVVVDRFGHPDHGDAQAAPL